MQLNTREIRAHYGNSILDLLLLTNAIHTSSMPLEQCRDQLVKPEDEKTHTAVTSSIRDQKTLNRRNTFTVFNVFNQRISFGG